MRTDGQTDITKLMAFRNFAKASDKSKTAIIILRNVKDVSISVR